MNPTPFSARLVIWVWLIAAIAIGNSLLLQRLPLPALQVILCALTGGVLVLYWQIASLRRWLDHMDLRALVALHCIRYVGIYFLILHHRGVLPRDFAIPAGWGDITVATVALALSFLPLPAPARRRAIRIWNVVGFVDLLLVMVTAASLGLQGNLQMKAMASLPLSLLPTFLIPLLLATHVIIHLRLQREEPQA